MSIKFPDMQVLVGRTDQVPRVLKEGDPTGAGKMAPEIMREFSMKPKKVATSPRSEKLKDKEEKSKKKGRSNSKGGTVDLRA